MARCEPQLGVVHIRSDDFLKSTLFVLISEEFNERIVNVRAMGGKEAGSGTEFVEKEKFIFPAQFSVISFSCFFLDPLPFF